jgi:YidC/Oxa1 family membrane protein insertase
MQNDNTKNIIFASILSAVILISWTWFYEKPKLEAAKSLEQARQINSQSPTSSEQKSQDLSTNPNLLIQNPISAIQNTDKILPKEEIIAETKNQRISIKTPELEGSINLKGLIFDDLTLVNYQETLDPKSEEVTLLSPAGSANQYQVNFGYKALDAKIIMPNQDSLWKADGKVLTPQNPITFSWQNGQNINFEIKIAIDEHYMFSISQTIKNNSGQKLDGVTTANIGRLLPQLHSSSYVLHEGPIGVFDGILKEKSYTNLRDKKGDNNFYAQTGWFGITDKYWLISIIPDKKSSFETKFSYSGNKENNIYNADFQSQQFSVDNGKEISFENKMFAGAKRVSVLDEYSKKYDITRFDLAVDFGWYYFLTKPFFFILQFFSKIFGNYGLAILAITVLVKLAMLPLANKSYTAIAKIKKLQPKIDAIREQFKDKKLQMNKEIMQLYKKEKVNPVSGCLPMLIQIPVFFSLYKVLYLTIDMRHAPFYGWIKDLSAPDPTSIFNLFGLLPFDTHGIISIGLWPIFMGITMIVQQKLNPQPSDPAQAKVMKLLPFILIFAFAAFPAGLLIYWTWSNTLSILQQWFITKRLEKKLSK